MAQLTRRAPSPARRRSRIEDIGGLFKRVFLKITRPISRSAIRAEEKTDWAPLDWLRSWESDPVQQIETTVNEPVRNVNHIHESIYFASTITGFML
jgi:hypothetical protein